MPDEPLGTGLLDTLNNGLKQIIEQLKEIGNKLESIEKHIDLANEAASTILDLLTTQETANGTTPPIPSFEFPKVTKKKPK